MSAVSQKALTFFSATVVAVLLTSARVSAAGLASGHYIFAVQYSPVCFNGVYPLATGEMTTGCFLEVGIDVDGTVTGTLNMRTLKGPTSGTLTFQNNTLFLHLQTSGQDPSQTPSDIQGSLQGNK